VPRVSRGLRDLGIHPVPRSPYSGNLYEPYPSLGARPTFPQSSPAQIRLMFRVEHFHVLECTYNAVRSACNCES
jgi:hypothetical protein